jgi:hypothetical protein
VTERWRKKPPRWNPEGFWRTRRSHTRAVERHDQLVAAMDAVETWRQGVYPPSLDLDEIPPPMILVGRRRAKAMRRMFAASRRA